MYSGIDKTLVSDTLKVIASKFSKALQDVLMKVFGLMKEETTQKEMLQALETGGLSALFLLLQKWEDIIGSHLLLVLQENIIQSGRFFIGNLPKGSLSRELPNTLFTPGVIQIINTYGASLVKNISNEAKKVVQEQVKINMIAGRNPVKTARDIRDAIGLSVPLLQAVDRYKKALESGDVTFLREMLNDSRNNLRDHRFDNQLIALVENRKTNIPQATIDKMVRRYTERLIKYRSEVIARTESLRALSMAEYESIIEANKMGSLNSDLRRFWIHAKDERVRIAHIEIPKLNPHGVAVDEPFRTPLGLLKYPRDIDGMPQNVINCRCTLGYRIVKR